MKASRSAFVRAWCSQIAPIAALALSAPATADDWGFTSTLYGWFPGVSTTVETPFGEVDADVDFDEILETLDFAFLAAVQARNGRWSLTGDVQFFDVSADVSTLPGPLFASGKVDSQTVLASAYTTYAALDASDFRLDLGGGLRYAYATIDTGLIGEGPVANASFSKEGGWVDLLLAARFSGDFSERWYGVSYADVGGFGIDDSSDLTWQVGASIGYRFTDTWSAIGGYRHLSIDREFDRTDVKTVVSGPLLGVQVTF